MDQLIYEIPLSPVGEKRVQMASMIERLSNNEIVIPEFQRSFVWDKKKISEWGKTIIRNKAKGVLVTYQIPPSGITYIADGRQRIEATEKFMGAPEYYGFDFDKKQAEIYVKNFEVTVQHDHYETHWEALIDFQRMNSGSNLTPSEFHKGALTLDPIGKIVYSKVPEIINAYERSFLGRVNRASEGKLTRSGIASFWQYADNVTQITFGNAGTNRCGWDSRTNEVIVANWIKTNSVALHEVDALLQNFEAFIASHFKTIRTILIEIKAPDKYLAPLLSRHFLAVDIWRKNTNKPVFLYEEYVKATLKLMKKMPTFSSRFILPRKDGSELPITLHFDSITETGSICENLDLKLWSYKQPTNYKVQPGCDVSHVKPYSKHMDNKTIIEPSNRNRARGARPI